jgi:hypothetical protein
MRALLGLLAACGGGSHAAPPDAVADATPDAATDKAAHCASTFGMALTAGFARLDGTVLAVVPPGDQACALPNATHLVVQVTMGGQAYRMVVDVLSNQGSPNVWLAEHDAPLAGPAWSDGWHTGVALDYVSDLSIHSTAFTEEPEAQLVGAITQKIDLGTKISIFATAGTTEPHSAHLVHRNAPHADGAIVLSPDTAPHYVLLRFAEQSF